MCKTEMVYTKERGGQGPPETEHLLCAREQESCNEDGDRDHAGVMLQQLRQRRSETKHEE